jgi:hypothetical protein
MALSKCGRGSRRSARATAKRRTRLFGQGGGLVSDHGRSPFLAELIGSLLLSIGVSLLFQKTVVIKVLIDLTANRSALFMVGYCCCWLACGSCLGNIWTGGVPATLIGWVLTLASYRSKSKFVSGSYLNFGALNLPLS